MRNLVTSLAIVALSGVTMAQNQNLVYITNGTPGGTIAPTAGAAGSGADSANTRKVVVFDVNEDGNDDLYFLNHGVASVGLISNGAGSYSVDPASGDELYQTATVGAKAILPFDADNDGDLDVYICTGPLGGVQQNNLWLANLPGAGSTNYSDVSFAEPQHGDHSYDAAFLILNGVEALVVANRTGTGVTGQNRLYTHTGGGLYATATATDGHFNSANLAEVRNSRAVLTGDLDGDGLQDVLLANAGNSGEANQAFRQSGSSLLLDAVAGFAANPGNSYGLALGDLDGDGDLDVVVANRASTSLGEANTLWQNVSGVGNIDFAELTTTVIDDALDTSYDVTLGDLDGDTDLDLIVANNLGNNAIYMNNTVELSLVGIQSNTFTQVADGLLQSNRGRTRSAVIDELGDYGPNNNHQGAEVVFANAITGSNTYFRGMGKQFADLGGNTTSGTTNNVLLEGNGFFSPSTGSGGALVISNGEANATAILQMALAATSVPFNGGSQVASGGVSTAAFNLDGVGALNLAVAAGDIPAALIGEFLVVQIVTDDGTLGAGQALSNGVSMVVQ